MVRVYLVDDHVMFREALAELLSRHQWIELAGMASSLGQALDDLQRLPVDVVILDLGLPDGHGLQGLERILSARSDLPVVVLTSHPEDHVAMRCLQAGAAGFIHKREVAATVIDAVRSVADGRRYIGPELAGRIASTVAGDSPAERPHDSLSNREFQVFAGLVAGQSVSEIAATLHLSVKTVSTYKSRLQDKLDVRGTAGLVRYALAEGLFEPQ
ncbi:MAG: response regulator transcription factor [Acidobacteriota bacterium]